MISKNKFYLLSFITIGILLLSKIPIIKLLEKTTLNFSPDKFVKTSTIDLLYFLFILTVFIVIIIFYLIYYTKFLKSNENKIILTAILLEYLVVLIIFINGAKWLSNHIYNPFAFINTIQLLIS